MILKSKKKQPTSDIMIYNNKVLGYSDKLCLMTAEIVKATNTFFISSVYSKICNGNPNEVYKIP